MIRRSLLPLTLALVLGCTAVSRPPAAPRHLVLAATTDVHGWIAGHEEKFSDGRPEQWRSGGLDVLGGYLANLRAANPNVILLDSGDMYQGTLESNLSEGDPVVRAFNELRYDAVAVGNHEFDFGPVGPKSTPTDPTDDPFGALKRNISNAKYPFLAANVREKSTGRIPSWARPHVLIERGGVKVGIIGIITQETPTTTFPVNVQTLEFTDSVAAIRQSAAELRRQGADLVVVTMHVGGDCKELDDPHDVSSCRAESHMFVIARGLAPSEVDVIFGGHTHQQVRHFVNGIALAQAPPLGRGLSVVDVYVDRATRTVLRDRTVIRPHTLICERVFESGGCSPRTAEGALRQATFEGRPVTPDPRVRAIIEPVMATVAEKKRQLLPIRLAAPFTREYRAESTIGNLLADAMRAAVPDAEFGILNSGGIRADLRGPEVTFGDMFEMLPFDNFVTRVLLTGRQIERMIEISMSGDHGALQVSGLRVEVTRGADGTKPTVVVMKADGTPLDPNRKYVVATVDFLAAGGSGMAPVMNEVAPADKTIYYDLRMRETAIEQLQKMSARGPLVPKIEGRIVQR